MSIALSRTVRLASVSALTVSLLLAPLATSSTPGFAAPTPAKPWDVNGDGFADLVLAAPGEDFAGQRSTGLVHVLYGGSAGISGSGSRAWGPSDLGLPPADAHGLTARLASADFNRDGYAETVIGFDSIEDSGQGSGTMTGGVVVLRGSAQGPTAPTLVSSPCKGPVERLATGDVDGDGYPDLAQAELAGDNPTGTDPGTRVCVKPGSSRGLAGNALVLDGTEEDFGSHVVTGDFNGDGRADLAIGAGFDGAFNSGSVLVYYGRSGRDAMGRLRVGGKQRWTLDSPGVAGQPSSDDDGGQSYSVDWFGKELTSGDLNHDRRDELVIAAPGTDRRDSTGTVLAHDTGSVHVLIGSSSGLTATGSRMLTQSSTGMPDTPEEGDFFGYALAAADTNRDGYAELAIQNGGIYSASEGIVVVPGSSTGLATRQTKLWTQEVAGVPDTTEPDDRWGEFLRFAPYKGPGRIGLAVGATGEDNLAGAVTMIYTTSTGMTASGSTRFTQNSVGVPGQAEPIDLFGAWR
jgi:hypothetical protein